MPTDSPAPRGRTHARSRYITLAAILFASVIHPAGVATTQAETPPVASPAQPQFPRIFDGKTLDGWRIIEQFDFSHHGNIEVRDGVIYLEKGKPATGISWAGDLPRSNYEVTFSGQRVDGSDFFCGLTFPVKEEHCTLILGGWGGSVVGLSNIDGFSAVENNTTQVVEFKQGQWYRVKLSVSDERIVVAIDDKEIINEATEGHKFSIWWEQEPVTPLGIVTWYTTGAIKDLEFQPLREK